MAQLKSTLITGTLDVTGSISQKGIALSNTYLGKTDTAINSAKLNNQDPSYYLAWANITDKPTNLVTTNSNGKIPESYLPSYVDDVIEGYYYNSKFYKESSHTTVIAAESGKIYIDLATNKTYRWSGSAYAEISASLALGETSSTAYAGDKGKANATNIAALQTTINNALPLNAGNNVKFTSENGGITISAEGSVKKVNNQEPDNNGNVSITLDNINDGSSRKLANYLPLSGGTMTGNLEFSSISYSNAPVSSKGLTWRGGTDAAEIFYRLDANDAGRLVFKTHDDDNCNFVWENSVQGQWMNLSKNGTLAVKGDITSNGNKVALDKDVVKLTGNQTISGTKTFSGKIINTYLQHGIIDTHPENNGTIISYYTNDLGYLFERGGSCVATNITQNKTITVPADAFDCSPSYWYLSLNSTSDVVQILVKTSQVYSYTTRGGIGFGASAWRAKDVKIEVGYSATNTGTASSPDTDIVWKTKINLTGQGEGLVCGDITGPNAAENGNSQNHNEWSYMRLTLTNWTTVNPRIAQIFSVTYNSRGMHNAFLSKNGGYVYGNILPSNNNRYLGNGSENWAAVYSRFFYENGTSLADKYAAKTIKLSDNVDLNTVASSGFYRLMKMSSNTNFSHSQMIVSRGDDTIAQMVFPYGDTKMYIRTGNPFNTSGGLWHDWKEVAFTDHTHTSINTAFVFNNNDMPQGSANLSATTNAHQISFYRNGLSVPYQMDNSNDGGILRCRGNSESNVIFELATWDDSGAGETIQFNYYPTNSQATPTYSVTVPKKTGTILLTTDSSSAGNRGANKVVLAKADGQIDSDKFTVTSAGTTKATMQYNSTDDCIEFIFA